MLKVIPFFDAKVPTGFPSPANDYLEKPIDLNETFIKHPLSTFLISTEGNSMLKAFIPEKSTLLIDRSLTAKSGDIVLAQVDGEFTVKYIFFKNKSCYLVPANDDYSVVEVTEEMNMQVWGVVITIFINPKDVKNVCPRRL